MEIVTPGAVKYDFSMYYLSRTIEKKMSLIVLQVKGYLRKQNGIVFGSGHFSNCGPFKAGPVFPRKFSVHYAVNSKTA